MYDEVDRGRSSAADKSSKCQKLVKNPKNLKSLESLQKPLVWKNIYESTNPPLIRYEKLEFFLLGLKKLSQNHFYFNYQ